MNDRPSTTARLWSALGGPDRTRLIVRVRGRCGPWWVRALFVGAIIPADFVMARSMLRGVKVRAENRKRSRTHR